jgi:hypothetical protein
MRPYSFVVDVLISGQPLQRQQRFAVCAQIVESGLVSAGLPCSWIDVVMRCRFTRQLGVWWCPFKGQTLQR